MPCATLRLIAHVCLIDPTISSDLSQKCQDLKERLRVRRFNLFTFECFLHAIARFIGQRHFQ